MVVDLLDREVEALRAFSFFLEADLPRVLSLCAFLRLFGVEARFSDFDLLFDRPLVSFSCILTSCAFTSAFLAAVLFAFRNFISFLAILPSSAQAQVQLG